MTQYEEALARARAAYNQLLEEQARLWLTSPEGSHHPIFPRAQEWALEHFNTHRVISGRYSDTILWPGFQPTNLVSQAEALGQDSAMESALEDDGPRWLSQWCKHG